MAKNGSSVALEKNDPVFVRHLMGGQITATSGQIGSIYWERISTGAPVAVCRHKPRHFVGAAAHGPIGLWQAALGQLSCGESSQNPKASMGLSSCPSMWQCACQSNGGMALQNSTVAATACFPQTVSTGNDRPEAC